MKKLAAMIVLILTALATAYADNRKNELTGVYRKSSGKQPAYLQIDGNGSITRIEVSGACLKDIPDGTRLWVKGQVKTWLQGINNADRKPASVEEITQQQPVQWLIVMVVEESHEITEPFGRPSMKKTDKTQNKASQAIGAPGAPQPER